MSNDRRFPDQPIDKRNIQCDVAESHNVRCFHCENRWAMCEFMRCPYCESVVQSIKIVDTQMSVEILFINDLEWHKWLREQKGMFPTYRIIDDEL